MAKTGTKRGKGAFEMVMTCINLILAITLVTLKRRQTVRALEDDEKVQLLLLQNRKAEEGDKQ